MLASCLLPTTCDPMLPHPTLQHGPTDFELLEALRRPGGWDGRVPLSAETLSPDGDLGGEDEECAPPTKGWPRGRWMEAGWQDWIPTPADWIPTPADTSANEGAADGGMAHRLDRASPFSDPISETYSTEPDHLCVCHFRCLDEVNPYLRSKCHVFLTHYK